MIFDFLTSLEKVQIALTRAEREAIWRFRYEVYVRELGKTVANADHEHGWIRDPDEEQQSVVLFYTGTTSEVTGTLRVDTWAPGHAPLAVARRYGFEELPALVAQPIAEASRLMVRRALRGKLIVPALARRAFTYAVDRGVLASFAYCAPGLVTGYRRLGYRPYGADLIDTPDGLRVPLVMATNDVAHFRSVDSPLYSLAKERFHTGSRETFDMITEELGIEGSVQVDEGEVWRDVQSALLARSTRPTLFDGLTDVQIRLVTSMGFVVDVETGNTVTREDLNERELYVILEGEFAISRAGKEVSRVSQGDVVGEIGFLLEHGRRSATIRARRDGKLLVLRRKMLDDLGAREAPVAHQLLLNLARVTAARLSKMVVGS